jgi:Terminase RNaseH-like domain
MRCRGYGGGLTGDILLLRRLGEILDRETDRGEQVRDALIAGLLKVRNKDRDLVLLQPNRGQREYARRCTKRNVVLKARQLGMTTYVAARFFIQTITQPGTVTVQVAHSQESAEEIFQIVHRFWENLPKGMREGALVRSRASVRQIVFPRLDSEYRVATAADPNAGRGMTIHNLHCSEVARWPRDGEETLASLRAAVPVEGEIVLESTPNGAGGVFYEEWQRAAETGYTQHFFPWWYDEQSRVEEAGLQPLTPEEEELVKSAGLDEEQIAWRRRHRAQLRGLAAQEYAEDPVTCFRASGECVFEIEAIEQALEAAGPAFEARDNGRLLIWLPVQAGKQYMLGVDPAGGGSEGDYSCAQVIERKSGMQCAELHGHFPPRELAGKLIELAKIYNGALLAVERNNHGYGVLAHLRAAGYGNVYREGGQDGWLTSAVSRPAMIENLAAVLATAPGLFASPRLLKECRTFVRQVDGGTGAAAGTHDDCVMAMAIALGVRAAVAGQLSHQGMVELASLAMAEGNQGGQGGMFIRHSRDHATALRM